MSKIPNIITLSNAVCGVLALLLFNPIWGAYLILLAMILDTADGFAARMLNVKSELGKQLDSLSDLISFGVAPGFLYYTLFNDIESLLACIFYILSALYRLAKFNTEEYSTEFNGLPSPAAAGIVTGYVLLYALDTPSSPDILILAAIILPAICMNVRMSFFSLKGDNLKKDWKIWFVLLTTILTLSIDWHYSLLFCFTSYLFVSFVAGGYRNLRNS